VIPKAYSLQIDLIDKNYFSLMSVSRIYRYLFLAETLNY
jgi:hypothetical protein